MGLVTFDALELLLSGGVGPELLMQLGGSFSQSGRHVFARSFAALCAQARELEALRLYACSAAVQTLAIDRARIDERLDGVMSTPGFLKLAGSAQIIFV